jgi:hypothetical protein
MQCIELLPQPITLAGGWQTRRDLVCQSSPIDRGITTSNSARQQK